ncbi:DUF5684 domain-containing protein [Chloroflexota bacterium]
MIDYTYLLLNYLGSYYLFTFLFSGIFGLVYIVAFWKIFEKAGKPGWAAIVPIYKVIVHLEVVGRPIWWLVLFLIPGVNLVAWVIVYCFDLAKVFGKGGGFAIGLVFLNLIFLIILAFDESIQYIGPIAPLNDIELDEYLRRKSVPVGGPIVSESGQKPTWNPPKEPRVAPLKRKKPNVPAWLIDSKGRTFQLYQEVTTLGKMSENDIQSRDSTVSRRHAKITESNGHFTIIDLGSTNGTRLNGQLIRTPRLLAAGDEIQLGDSTNYTFKC